METPSNIEHSTSNAERRGMPGIRSAVRGMEGRESRTTDEHESSLPAGGEAPGEVALCALLFKTFSIAFIGVFRRVPLPIPRKLGRSTIDVGCSMFSSRSLRPCVFAPLRLCVNLCFLCGILFTTGCAGYRVGPTNGLPAGSRSVQVNIFQNKVLEEPRLSEYVTHALRKRLQQDGTFTLDTHNTGDIIVTGTILRYHRAGLSYQPRDIITPRDYLVMMFAQVTAREQTSGKLLLNNRRVQGRTTVRIGSDLTTSERQSIPLVADDLARNITALLADGEW